jgi:hypothetical protein
MLLLSMIIYTGCKEKEKEEAPEVCKEYTVLVKAKHNCDNIARLICDLYTYGKTSELNKIIEKHEFEDSVTERLLEDDKKRQAVYVTAEARETGYNVDFAAGVVSYNIRLVASTADNLVKDYSVFILTDVSGKIQKIQGY